MWWWCAQSGAQTALHSKRVLEGGRNPTARWGRITAGLGRDEAITAVGQNNQSRRRWKGMVMAGDEACLLLLGGPGWLRCRWLAGKSALWRRSGAAQH